MASQLAIRDGWFVRVLRALKLVEVSAEGEINHSAGADFIPSNPAAPAYDPLASLSSMASFPWVYSAVTALATDISKVPIRVVRGEGADAEVIDDHPLVDLLAKPSSRVPSVLFFRQIVTDLALTGDAFVLVAGRNQPEALLRLHPSRVRINPQVDGQPSSYYYAGGGESVEYSFDQVLHIRSPSWADDPRSLWGVGAIQSLHNDLMTDKRTQELTAASAQTGRPTGIISPSEEGDRWSSEQIKVIRRATEQQMSSGSGLLVMGGALEYTPVGWSPKDMEFASVREMTRSAVLACLDVPPTRVGLPSANYATSREQAKRYWEGISGKCALIASELDRLAKMFPDGENLTVRFDFSEIEALQESRSDRVNRVLQWVTMGVPVADAAAYEGFEDLPTDNLIDTYAMQDEDAPADDEPEPEPDDNAEEAEDTDEEIDRSAILDFVTRGLVQTRKAYEDIDFGLPDGVIVELERGIEWYEQGEAGDGLTEKTVRDARKMVREKRATEDKVRLMVPWFARHEEDQKGEGFEPGEDGYPSPGRVAWALWGGTAGARWSAKVLRQMDAEDEREGRDGSTDVVNLEAEPETKLTPCADLTCKDTRQEYMRQFIQRVNVPFERELGLTIKRFLRGQAARIAKRAEALQGTPTKKGFGAETVTRATLGETWLKDILNQLREMEMFRNVTRPVLRRLIREAVNRAVRESGAGVDFVLTPEWITNQVEAFTYDLAEHVNQYTAQIVEQTIEKGIDEGFTIGEIQNELMQSHAFKPARALRIARTEVTRAVATGTRKTYDELENRGIELERTWLAAPDARAAHGALDGETAGTDGKFTIPIGAPYAGKQTRNPGGFGVGALDINCRCTITARVKK